MRELGRRGGRVGKGNAQLRRSIAGGPNLREYLLENVSPQEVWGALKAAMEGSSEAARVSAAKVLLDALQERQQDRDRQADAAGAKERLIRARRSGGADRAGGEGAAGVRAA